MIFIASAVSFLVVSMLGGFAHARSTKKALLETLSNIDQFLRSLRGYVESNGTDSRAYTQLLTLSALLQEDLGADAIVSFKHPYSNSIDPNYPALVNFVPSLHFEMNVTRYKDAASAALYTSYLQDILIRGRSRIERTLNENRKLIRSPLGLTLVGLQLVLAIPATVLAAAGAISQQTARSWSGSMLLRVLSALIFVLTLLGTVISIVVGWSDFLSILVRLVRRQ